MEKSKDNKDNFVNLKEAEELGLIPWDDYCPECGYTILDDESTEPFVICLSCGATSVG